MNKPNLIQIIKRSGLVNTQKEAVNLIKKGKVKVKGKVVRDIYYQARASNVLIDDKPIPQVKEKVYFLLNKPRGFSCHKIDKKNIWQLFKLPKELQNTIYSVGRLDIDTTGLLIVTNDGSIMHKVINPEKDVWKTYVAFADKDLSTEAVERIKKGIVIKTDEGNYKCLPAFIEKIKPRKYEIKIKEGKKRQIRRMLEAAGAKCLELKRTAIGKLELPKLKEGEYKEITKEDLKKVFY